MTRHKINEKNNKSPDDWADEYDRIRPKYTRFTNKLESLLTDLLAAKNINYHLLESRTKDVGSFREKITRSSNSYSLPLTELTDLSGLRVIAYYQDDADKVCQLIKNEFEIDSLNTVEHSPDAAEFGYRSAHYVVSISPDRAKLLEWDSLHELKAEIQIRTVLQHAWAAISHKLQYKREKDVPVPLRRKLFRLSALFELADDEFISLRNASEMLAQEIGLQLTSGNTNIAIDYESMSQFIEKSKIVSDLYKISHKVGFSNSEQEYFEDIDRDIISDLIQLTMKCNIKTITSLETLLNESLSWAEEYLHKQYAYAKNIVWVVSPAFICELILIRVNHSHLETKDLMAIGWSKNVSDRVLKVASIH